jgi:hypothetical protein
MLVAGRPIMIKAKKQSIPNGFTLYRSNTTAIILNA